MAGDTSVVHGLDDLKRKLQELPAKMRSRVLRNALAAGARLVQREARRTAPVLQASRTAPFRRPGTVRDAIRVRTSKAARRSGDVGVFVNVRPAKGTERGAKNPRDPFYWRFLEFGTRKMPARSYLRTAAERLPDALRMFNETVGKWIAKVNATGKVER